MTLALFGPGSLLRWAPSEGAPSQLPPLLAYRADIDERCGLARKALAHLALDQFQRFPGHEDGAGAATWTMRAAMCVGIPTAV